MKRKMIALGLILVLLAISFSFASASSSKKTGYVVTTDWLHFRAKPQGTILDTIPPGTLLRASYHDEFYTKVIYKDSIGYVYNKYIVIYRTDDAPFQERCESLVAVGKAKAIKSSPIYDDSKVKLGKMPKGTKVNVYAINGKWVLAGAYGKYGIVKKSSLKMY